MVTILANRAWYDLRSTAHAHGLPFHTRHTKAQVCDRLYHSLIQEGVLRRRFKQFSENERSALTALQAAGGTLPLHRFQTAYGAIRIYRPWRDDGTPKQPWKKPQSVAEKLWHFGFIEIIKGKPNQVTLPDEVLALLPPLPRIEPIEKSPLPAMGRGFRGGDCQTLCIDLALLLGALLYHDVRPLHGRWLPPSALRSINTRLRIPENLEGVRSELRTGRLRFLHYLAEAAGLVAVQAGVLKPTVQAWRWLDLPPDERWLALRDAVSADLKTRNRLWDRYRLPSVDVQTWQILVDHLQQLPPGCTYTRESLIRIMQSHLPGSDLSALIPPLLDEPLTWLGSVNVESDIFIVLPRSFSEPQNAQLVQREDAIDVVLSDAPRLHPLVMGCAWAEVQDNRLPIDAAAIRRALETGSDALQFASVLAELIDEPLPAAVIEQIQRWSREAAALTLRQVTLLTARDADTLAEIRSDWRLRPLLGEPLSPHHGVVPTGRAEDLLAKLERRGCPVTSHLKPSPSPDGSALSPEMAAYLWLAVRVYQKLGAFVSQDIPIPGAAREWLMQQLPMGSADSLERESNLLIDRFSQMIRGEPTSPSIIQQEDPIAVRAAVQSAYERRGALTIEYFSPARGEKTVRTIEPVMLYERNGAEYVEAWCRLDDDTRTFRLDRIVSVIADGENTGHHHPG
ncbi:WYL domain-containing protein [Anaerolineae bacterium CFX9]|nr:WYL domain-containing protein [Anaerolineae bacterium CFX9]